ncbi:MAG TPA: hypothetical protein VFK43_19930, partial [Acidimicrobiales bacterium]|nr:hypothetical protein [Acidimicrobiales bacterium]
MATALNPTIAAGDDVALPDASRSRTARLRPALAPVAVGLAVAGAVLARDSGHLKTALLYAATVLAWATAGAVITVRRPGERQGSLILQASVL